MAATSAVSILGAVVGVTPPDFFHCNRLYGTGIQASDCITAATMFPEGNHMIPFAVGANDGLGFPMQKSHGSCNIVAELAGPVLPGIMNTIPNIIRALAAIVVAQCVLIQSGIGGFATYGLGNLVNYVLDRGTSEMHDPDSSFPTSTAFITLTVYNNLLRLPSPGDTDPSIPLRVASGLNEAAKKADPGSDLEKFLLLDSTIWSHAAMMLIPGSSTTWWKVLLLPSTSDKMAYECDPSLGKPTDVDCSNIEWNQLGPASLTPPSEAVIVGPGVARFFHSNSCYLAISSSVSIVLNWAQIRDAVAVLMSMCIENPGLPSQGGRAYYSTSGMTGRRRKRQMQLNALPRGVNITIFQQLELWTNPEDELKGCTWEMASNREPVSKCTTA